MSRNRCGGLQIKVTYLSLSFLEDLIFVKSYGILMKLSIFLPSSFCFLFNEITNKNVEV